MHDVRQYRRSRPTNALEVGVVYRSADGSLLLALAHDRAVTRIGRRFGVVECGADGLAVDRDLAVEDLARAWKMSVEQLDEQVSRRWFAPRASGRDVSSRPAARPQASLGAVLERRARVVRAG